MERTWLVTATYIPRPRLRVRFDRYSVTREEWTPAAAGTSFSFKVRGMVDAMEAVTMVKRSGYFLGRMLEDFGFAVVEMT
jgi:hypothetical protein